MKKLLGFLLLLGLALAQNGPQLYQQNCAFCHGENGQGRPGAFPPLAAHAPELIKTPEGRAHLINAVLFGMQGPVRVKGSTYNGVMPAFAQLSDEQVAAVLNYVLSAWGNDKLLPRDHRPVTVAEVNAARNVQNRPTPQQVGINRARINLP
ncbi:cytochrome c [Meiothermus sp.]|uniref:c-type cytochrome n=1 Tax=Meiothermus sp. TaxID=1955249 RepID=UPI0021DDF997|nr:cytochrome c [Meiothermus sp.]GIW24300.1 MAG: cytochrome c-552 [Meiothermus sp.]